MKKITLIICLILIAIFLIIYSNQIKYVFNITIDRLSKKIQSCEVTEKQVNFENIIFNFDCDFLAFTNKLTYSRGDEIIVYFYGKEKVDVRFYKYSYLNNAPKKLIKKIEYKVDKKVPEEFSDTFGFKTIDAQKLSFTSSELNSGWYGFEIHRKNKLDLNIPIFIEPITTEKIIFVESTDSLIAYNPANKIYGLPINYARSVSQLKRVDARFPKLYPVNYSQLSPKDFSLIECKEHLINADRVIKNFLSKNGIKFSSISDKQFDNSKLLDNVNLIIFGAHNEYWTKQKFENLSKFLKNGGKALFLGGNQAYREIKRHRTYYEIRDDNFEYHKEFFDKIKELTGSFFYDDMGSSGIYISKKNPVWDKRFKIKLADNVSFGQGTDFDHCSLPLTLSPFLFVKGASGIETDQLLNDAQNFNELARGDNQSGGASLIYKKFNEGGEVLNFSSVGLWHKLTDNIIKEIIMKFINKDEYTNLSKVSYGL